jgi:hypothetical protein
MYGYARVFLMVSFLQVFLPKLGTHLSLLSGMLHALAMTWLNVIILKTLCEYTLWSSPMRIFLHPLVDSSPEVCTD